MKNRQLYTLKFNSGRLKRFGYNISLTYEEAKVNGEIAPLAESQMLRTIRKAILEKGGNRLRRLNRRFLEWLIKKREKVKRKKNNKEAFEKINKRIIDMCYIPEYVTIVMEHDTHYDYLYENGVIINGVKYKRLSVSAGQARLSTVVFCSEDIIDRVNEILDNGRNKNVKFSPSKFSAYKGVYSSATKVVTTPRFCVVPDYESDYEFMCNWVTETDYESDDIIEQKMITRSFNRFDGQGLISPRMAKIWADDLYLDYIPAEFRVSLSYVKGMLAVFDIHEFCESENNGNYIINSIYKDESGNYIKVDLRDVDVILTESQFKLWNSYDSLEQYIFNCEKNEIYWSISSYTDKKLKNMLKMNYQFLQANNIQKSDIPELCSEFVNWINAVNYDDVWSTLLFLIGADTSDKKLRNYLNSEDGWWVKSIIVDHRMIEDKYIKQKIYKLMKKRIESGYIGNIYVKGNNQTLVSDPYAMMEHVCGKPVVGIIEKDRYYCNYWNELNVAKIVGMRPPLTSRAEVLPMNLSNTSKQMKWFEYLYGGIIVNVYGAETDYWAGSDYDMDFLSSSSNKILIKSVHKDEYPVCYQAPKPDKINFTDRDLFESDKFAFGSIIGSITNKSTSGHALLPHIVVEFGEDSEHYKILENRVKMTCKLQSAQIDKAKIGRDVKEIPKIWIDRKYIRETYADDVEKCKMYESIMLDRHPYFFIHLYGDTKAKLKKHISEYDITCKHRFGISLEEMMIKDNLSSEQIQYIELFNKYKPVIDTDSPMNNICKYLESVDWNVRKYIKESDCTDVIDILVDKSFIAIDYEYDLIYNELMRRVESMRKNKAVSSNDGKRKFNGNGSENIKKVYSTFRDKMLDLDVEYDVLLNTLIEIYYKDKKSLNKDVLWGAFGKDIVRNMINRKNDYLLFPFEDGSGNIEYLGKRFALRRVDDWSIMK